MTAKTYVAVTAAKKSDAEMPFTEFFKNIDQPWSPRGFATAPFGMCFLTVVGDIRIPGLTNG